MAALILGLAMLMGSALPVILQKKSTNAEAAKMIESAFEEYQEEAKADPVRQKEVTPQNVEHNGEKYPECAIEQNGHKMRYFLDVIGKPDESGKYPLYITLHGGGGGEDAEAENDEQWTQMFNYYRSAVTSGVYVACRGMDDTWNMHFLDESFPMYDRLIEDMILLKNVDPNRIYLLGFSAGGDGVYAVTPRMADRFAAVNMSSGHPNGEKLLNTANVPFEIQSGIRDYLSGDAMRSVRAAEFEKTLKEYHDKYGFGYEHRVLIHVPEGHNFNDCTKEVLPSKVLKNPEYFAEKAVKDDWISSFLEVYGGKKGKNPDDEEIDEKIGEMSYADPDEKFNSELYELITKKLGAETVEEDTNAVRYVSKYTRNACPEHIVWDLSSRAKDRKVTSFYWLKADPSVNKGIVTADFDAKSNTFTIKTSEDFEGDLSLLLNPEMVDIEKTVTIITPDGKQTVEPNPDEETAEESVRETGDAHLAWVREVEL